MENSVKQGGWWYEVSIGEDIFNVLLDVPENTKPLKSSEIVEIYDQDGNYVNPILDENDEVFEYIEKLLDESGLLD